MVVEKKDRWNYNRSLRQAFVGSCVICPMNMLYVSKLAPKVSGVLSRFQAVKSCPPAKTLFRTWAQFLILGPVQANIIAFMSGYLKNRSKIEGVQQWRTKSAGVYSLNMFFQPQAALITSSVIPMAMRTPASHAMLFSYSVLLSYVLNNKA